MKILHNELDEILLEIGKMLYLLCTSDLPVVMKIVGRYKVRAYFVGYKVRIDIREDK